MSQSSLSFVLNRYCGGAAQKLLALHIATNACDDGEYRLDLTKAALWCETSPRRVRDCLRDLKKHRVVSDFHTDDDENIVVYLAQPRVQS